MIEVGGATGRLGTLDGMEPKVPAGTIPVPAFEDGMIPSEAVVAITGLGLPSP